MAADKHNPTLPPGAKSITMKTESNAARFENGAEANRVDPLDLRHPRSTH